MKLLVASGNAKKLRELTQQLQHLSVEIVTSKDVGGVPDVDEDRPTFAGNAAKKAVSAASASGLWALADDSGLEVLELGGAPGVLSARFAGAHGDDAANNALLLEKLRDIPFNRRGARFVCALCLARPDGSVALEIEGTANGRVLSAPRGTHDFGYDPLFLFTEPGYAETNRGFAELEPHEKARVSHRGRALREFTRKLPDVLASDRIPT
ncbi:MAG: non-canonical purine NTP pyrophosphatase [Planctomycetota bacterium]|nr:non-canonical purine NTP pyrophosphatase [Planctomycetota bacterium]